MKGRFAFGSALALAATMAHGRDATPRVSAVDVRSEVEALAGPAMRGRGSGTADEARAAAWIAGQFKAFGLATAPGMTGFQQEAPLIFTKVTRRAKLTVGGVEVPALSVLRTNGGMTRGRAAILGSPDGPVPQTEVLVYTGPDGSFGKVRQALSERTKLVLIAEGEMSRRYVKMTGEAPSIRPRLADQPAPGGPAIVAIPAATLAGIAAGTEVALDIPVTVENGVTTNVIGFLPGTDAGAGVILLTAHYDHLGVRAHGAIMAGANDDASGTVAVIELARAFAGKPMKRGILFVAYGSEEIGGLGSTWFVDHPPVPLADIIANIEFEMIGAQDPKLPKGALMMTGSKRSDLFDLLKSRGAKVAADPYPDQNFFERSDNYALAQKGIVAHTLSGWAVTPTYHEPTDTVANLDISYMTAAIQSLIAPIRLLAAGDARPGWRPGGKPRPQSR